MTRRVGEHTAYVFDRIEADVGRAVAHGDVWFTDDRLHNVEAAREFGWDAVLFTRRLPL